MNLTVSPPNGLSAPHPISGRIATLDGFRAIAVSLVVLSHIGFSHVVPGQFGVTLFFFLSGYLITTLLRVEFERTGRIAFRPFYLRRAVRILPPMWLAIALSVALAAAGWIQPMNFEWLPADLFFLSNYLPYSSIPIGLWSLAIEEHYYVVFPLLALICLRSGGRTRLIMVCTAICVVSLLIRVAEYQAGHDSSDITFWTHTRLDSILFGAILALVANPAIEPGRQPLGIKTGYVVSVIILASTFIIRDEWFRSTIRFTLQGIGLILLFGSAIRDKGIIAKMLDCAPLRTVAAMSYTIYLTHTIFVEAAVTVLDGLDHAALMIIGVAASLAFSWFSLRWYETPLFAWRRRIERHWQTGRAGPRAEDGPPLAKRVTTDPAGGKACAGASETVP